MVYAEVAETVRGTLDSIVERDEAYARALEWRSRFGVVEDPRQGASDRGGLPQVQRRMEAITLEC
ncbi:MAG TPA: hypothetical protein VK357_01685 [Rubrobacteraceae bacterium]|nr:hypothetical protein [Rubrobacteraceae bacterium]